MNAIARYPAIGACQNPFRGSAVGAYAWDLDGVNDYSYISNPFTDSKLLTIAGFCYPEGGDGTEMRILMTAGFRMKLIRRDDHRLEMQCTNSTPTVIARMGTNGGYNVAGGPFHFHAAVDLGAGDGEFWMNGADDEDTFFRTITDDTMDLNDSQDLGYGALPDGSNPVNGRLAEVWVSDSAYLPGSTHNGYFYNSGRPGSMPASGIVDGVTPLIYIPYDPRVNKGSGGNFTLVGSLDVVAGPATW